MLIIIPSGYLVDILLFKPNFWEQRIITLAQRIQSHQNSVTEESHRNLESKKTILKWSDIRLLAQRNLLISLRKKKIKALASKALGSGTGQIKALASNFIGFSIFYASRSLYIRVDGFAVEPDHKVLGYCLLTVFFFLNFLYFNCCAPKWLVHVDSQMVAN